MFDGALVPETSSTRPSRPVGPSRQVFRESPLPSPWEAHRSEEGALYFYNRETGESEWTLPDELLARETPHRVNS